MWVFFCQVPLYAHGVSEYTITASMPTYPSSGNHREPNTTGCAFLTPLLWTFKDVPLLPTEPTRQQSAMGHLLVSSVSGNGSISKLTTVCGDSIVNHVLSQYLFLKTNWVGWRLISELTRVQRWLIKKMIGLRVATVQPASTRRNLFFVLMFYRKL